MRESASTAVERLLGCPARDETTLGSGLAAVARVELADGRRVVVKQGEGAECEAWMLALLAERSRLPLPEVLGVAEDTLVLEWVESDGRRSAEGRDADVEAAQLLAGLHAVSDPRGFGLERATTIGGLPQPNPWHPSWLEFFATSRLSFMAAMAERVGHLSSASRGRVEAVAANLSRWLDEPPASSLIHGDVWGGNVLLRGGRVAAFLDPAVYYADAEIELAFTTLFSTFGQGFYRAYDERRGIRPGFFELRRDLYNLYPLLVHAVLFGGSYVGQVDGITRRLAG